VTGWPDNFSRRLICAASHQFDFWWGERPREPARQQPRPTEINTMPFARLTCLGNQKNPSYACPTICADVADGFARNSETEKISRTKP